MQLCCCVTATSGSESPQLHDATLPHKKMTTTTTPVAAKFIVRVSYSYYPGTFYAPKNGALSDCNGDRIEFDSREDAEKYLTAVPELTEWGYTAGLCLTKNEDGSFSAPGTYCTSHGEYARPVYRIRKLAAR